MQEKTNVCDKYAIAVVLPNKTVVGHIPYDLAQIFSQFLRKGFNKDTVKVTGEKVNCGAGYGQEIPCVYMLYVLQHTLKECMKSTLRERNIGL